MPLGHAPISTVPISTLGTIRVLADVGGCLVWVSASWLLEAVPQGSVESLVITVAPTGGPTTSSSVEAPTAEVAVTPQVPTTHVPADVAKGAQVLAQATPTDASVQTTTDGATALATPSHASGQGVGMPGGADVTVGMQGVGAGVTTDVVRALVEVLAGRGETVLNVNVISGALVGVNAVPSDASGIGRPAPLVVEVVARDVDGRRTNRVIEFRLQELQASIADSQELEQVLQTIQTSEVTLASVHEVECVMPDVQELVVIWAGGPDER